MKLLMMLYTGSTPHRVADVLDAHEAHGFTEIDRAHGRGTTGRVEGTRAWPGESSVFFSIVPDDRVTDLERALRALAIGAAPGERLHVAVVPVEHFF
jgi:hypothetical protein